MPRPVDSTGGEGEPGISALTLDGAYEYSPEALAAWDADGRGSTFIKRFGTAAFELAVASGLDPCVKTEVIGNRDAQEAINYQPLYGVTELLEDLSKRQRELI
ncbi:hypothetical protein [Streptomyces sp. NPDC127084]|uniref:hypothetical protein n=1 Tax=Streptomyces sp. NPDC127084 TaxID=3347133 RepID=UPI003658C2F9